MAEHVMTSSYKDREEFRKRFESQILLRMCSCLQIASKLHTDQQVCVMTIFLTQSLPKLLNL